MIKQKKNKQEQKATGSQDRKTLDGGKVDEWRQVSRGDQVGVETEQSNRDRKTN